MAPLSLQIARNQSVGGGLLENMPKNLRWIIYYSRILADEALYYSTIYSDSCDSGTAHASLAFGQLGT